MRGRLRVRPQTPPPRRRSATLAAFTKLCPFQRAGTFPWNLQHPSENATLGRGEAGVPARGDTASDPAPLKGAPRPVLDAGFLSGSGKPGKRPHLFVFQCIIIILILPLDCRGDSNTRIGAPLLPLLRY